MNTSTTVGASTISAPKFNLDAMQQSVDALVAQGTKDLEIELREERIAPYIIDITKPIAEVVPLISIDGNAVCTAGNISAIVGEPKCKKTFLTTALVSSAFAYPFPDSLAFENVSANPALTVLWLDTEQSESHVRKVVERINAITGIARLGEQTDCRLTVLRLRELEPKDRREALRDSLFVRRPDIVVIDGIADLLYNTNDIEESDSLIGELMALSTQYNCHIINVLHTNPGTDKARGHIGSSLQRKSESVIYVHKDDNISIVECQYSRNEPFERFAFTVNDTGLPEICNLPTEITTKEDEVVSILNTYFSGSCERAVLSHKLEELLGLSRNAASMRIARALRKGTLTAEGKTIRAEGCTTQCNNVTLSQGCVTSVTSDNVLHDVTSVTPVTNVTPPQPVTAVTPLQSDNCCPISQASPFDDDDVQYDYSEPYDDDECPF